VDTLRDVLEWLATVEPERCQYDEGKLELPFDDVVSPCHALRLKEEFVPIFFGAEDLPSSSAAVEYVIREAIEARGWLWSIDRQHDGTFAASVSLYNRNSEDDILGVYVKPSPLLALANAYREAVEAT
jgi:hypothetical protein